MSTSAKAHRTPTRRPSDKACLTGPCGPSWPSRHRRLATFVLVSAMLVVLTAATAGFNSALGQSIDAEYGRQSGTGFRNSVNGTLVFSEMFRKDGHKVRSWRKLSPRIDKFNTLVWFPDRFGGPESDARGRIEEWLYESPGRTCIYVGRDYDALIEYWKQIEVDARARNAPRAELDSIRRHKASAQAAFDSRRHAATIGGDYGWYRVKSRVEPRTITDVKGTWSYVCQGQQTDIVVRSRFQVVPGAEIPRAFDDPYFVYRDAEMFEEVLLEANGIPLIIRIRFVTTYGSSQLILVTNGSFLLNLPLVNPAHRNIAQRLIDECQPNSDVLFLETGPEAVEVVDDEVSERQQTQWDWMSIWPLSFIVPHLFIIALVFCFAYFPIFGRAKHIQQDESSDFGKHITALGRLFARSDDGKYMLDKIKHYQEKVRRDSGASHAEDDALETESNADSNNPT